ncbi:chaperone modulator CbpM [Haloferula sp. BvORR071]|uniref:chaperone modulator CbpM n=1 Tax=Haloferula sp. BvORR071 TaxID=1396141 RepID=UPI0005510C04|nr:chaperone modulator CbpM [Haloferula sp. BvORR071]
MTYQQERGRGLPAPQALETKDLHDLEAAAELCGMHPEMILEYARADVIELRREGELYHLDCHAIHRLRQIAVLREERSMSLRSIRFVMDLMERLDSAEQELRVLRERV